MTVIPEDWSAQRLGRVSDHLTAMRARQEIVAGSDHPAALAATCDPDYIVTPAIELVSRKIEQLLRSRRRRLMITAPPQEFKSRLCAVWTPLRALQLHPDWRVMLLTYADGLAEEHSRAARGIVQEFGTGVRDSLTGGLLPDKLGLSLRNDRATAGNWLINEGDGGLVAAGRDATITGRRADLLIVDDPFKNMQEADSEAIRTKVLDWYRSVATTRLSAGASVILIQTRWHPEDLAGELLKADRSLPADKREWHYINIPAVAHPQLPDALGREPGTPLESARGRTKDDFEAIERTAGRRIWNALYQGSPTPPEGGLFSQAWFDEHRLTAMPERTRVRIVAVDPSESGEGDEAGIIGAALLANARPLITPEIAIAMMQKQPGLVVVPDPPEPQVVLTHDRSEPLTADAWAKAAVQLALETDASFIFVETYTAGVTYPGVVRTAIANRMVTETDPVTRAKLASLTQKVRPWREPGDAVARSALLRQAVETGTCVMLGDNMTEMERQAKLWNPGQHQPDRVAAAVIAHERLMTMLGKAAQFGNPARQREPSSRNQWLERKVG